MNDKKYQWILYLIVFVILSTITIQVYWNYKNYQVNKQQLINDVQVSLDNAVDTYYANLAEQSAFSFSFNSSGSTEGDSLFKQLLHPTELMRNRLLEPDSIELDVIEGLHVYGTTRFDTIFSRTRYNEDTIPNGSTMRRIQLVQSDSSARRNFENLTSKVIISMTQESLNLKRIDTILKDELSRKQITITYGLTYEAINDRNQSVNSFKKTNDTLNNQPMLSTISKSSFLPSGSSLSIQFSNETKVILKRILSGILISMVLVLAVISSLFYLLKIIKHQKQLAEVKNDLISNITHEFKTPIATIGVALESIKNFNVIDDKEKTQDYLNMSSDQLSKLNTMVEKLLETATLDSENLSLNKEDIDLVTMLESITNKHKVQLQDKTLTFETPVENAMVSIDIFHFENALNNIIDNAIKYGGNVISIDLKKTHLSTEISISDNGNNLQKANKEKIFEKFYRVPKGNTHDIKGFGIGLYYTKKIVDKHNGIVQADVDSNGTTFKIILPNERL